jgi:hypothetical protein
VTSDLYRVAERGLLVYHGGLGSVAHVEACERHKARRQQRVLPPEQTRGLWDEIFKGRQPMNRDQNGRPVFRAVRREADGTWSAVVWTGTGYVTNVERRYGYRTREEARRADPSDQVNRIEEDKT